MNMHECGFDSTLLADILAGRKLVEGRLAKGKFLDFNVGDHIDLREDVYIAGVIEKSIRHRGTVYITGIERYSTFEEMLRACGVAIVLPQVSSIEEGVDVYRRFYTVEDERKWGVLAAKFSLTERETIKSAPQA